MFGFTNSLRVDKHIVGLTKTTFINKGMVTLFCKQLTYGQVYGQFTNTTPVDKHMGGFANTTLMDNHVGETRFYQDQT